ncbi:hypothetical protein GCM10020000_11940 [Streptomyces olivoverticillatus]
MPSSSLRLQSKNVLGVAGIFPVTAIFGRPYVRTGLDQPLDGVGDFQLATCAGLDGGHCLVNGRGEEIHPDDGQVAAWFQGLFHQLQYPAIGIDFGHSEAAGILHLMHDDLGGGAVGGELFGHLGYAVREHIVAEIHDEIIVTQKVAGHGDGVGQAARLVLLDEGQAQPEPRAVAEHIGDLLYPRSPTTTPTSVTPKEPTDARTCSSTGLLAIGMSCFGIEWVNGRRRVPDPPDNTRAFMEDPLSR